MSKEVTFYMAGNNGSVLLSCATMLAPGLIQSHTRLDNLFPRASLITSSADHPKKKKSQLNMHVSKKESTVSNQLDIVHKLITSKEKMLKAYQDVFDGIRCFPGPPYHIQVDPNVTHKQTPCQPVPVISKSHLNKKLIRCYKLAS